MFRNLRCYLVGASVLFSPFCFAINYSLAPLMGAIEYKLPSKVPVTFINFMPFAIYASCTIKSENDETIFIQVKGLSRYGAINDIPLNAGDEITLPVKNGVKFKLMAAIAAQVQMTNTSSQPIAANCETIRGNR